MDYYIEIAPYISKGIVVTLQIFAVTILGSIPLGVLGAIGKIVGPKPVKWLLSIYTWLLRGTPLLLQLLFMYFGLWALGVEIDRMHAAYLAFIFNYTAYFIEIFRAGIQSIDKGQFEASKALGMNYRQTMVRIILPQAMKRMIPPVGNEIITLVKDSALVMILAIGDVMRNSKEIVSRDSRIDAFILAALIYLLLTYGIVFIFKKIEKKTAYYD